MAPDHQLAALLEPLVTEPGRSAILLDLDGTLAPIVARPDDVDIPLPLRALLATLPGRYGLVAFVSGRALGDLRRIVGLDGVAYSGNHGMELVLTDGRSLPPPGIDLRSLRAFVAEWPAGRLQPFGIWLEDKGATLTFHYRTAPDPERARVYLETHVAPAGTVAGLSVAPGRMSLEVHPPGGVNKGTAVAALLRETPGIHHAVSVGDDRTDTDVWSVLRQMIRSGELVTGAGIAVTSSETPSVVLESADALVAGVAGVEQVLAHLSAAHAV